MRARHAGIGDIGGAAGENVLVGCGDVRVRAQDGGNFAVEIPAHGLLFGSGFGVHIYDDYFHVSRNFRALAIGGAERIIERGHEGSSLQIHYRVADAGFCFADVKTRAGKPVRKIRRTQQARLVREKIQDLLAIPDVIAAGEHFDSAGEEFFSKARCDTEARRGIFPIGDAEIDAALRKDVVQAVVNDFAAGRPDDVSYE